MIPSSDNVHDLMASESSSRPSVETRVQTRLEVLKRWQKDGLPFGAKIPDSLTAVRLWHDPDLKILRISSPNEFTRNHPRFGEQIREIDSILATLKVRYETPGAEDPPKQTPRESRLDPEALEKQLQSAASQWHTERSKRQAAERRAAAAESRNIMLKKDLEARENLIADLTSQAAGTPRLRPVK